MIWTPRQYRYIRILRKRRLMPSNNTNKFGHEKPLVMYTAPFRFEGQPKTVPAYIESLDNSNEHPGVFHYTITLEPGAATRRVEERTLRDMRWWEFAWFRHPKKGYMMCGKTRGWMAVLIHLFGLILTATCLATWGQGPVWTGLVVVALMIGGFWRYTFKNWNGTSV